MTVLQIPFHISVSIALALTFEGHRKGASLRQPRSRHRKIFNSAASPIRQAATSIFTASSAIPRVSARRRPKEEYGWPLSNE